MRRSIKLMSLFAIICSLISLPPGCRGGDVQGSHDNADLSRLAKDGEKVAMKTDSINSTAFALKLFTRTPRKADENVLVSPFSAYAALSMTLNGAGGSTREQMASALGARGNAVDELNARNQSILADLNANKNVRMEIANAIYVDRHIPLAKSFIELCQRVYGAEAHNEDFADKATVRAINDWCDQKTHGKITRILDDLSPEEKMVLLNAIYFKGAWERQFPQALTVDDKFTSATGEKVAVKMMRQTQDYLYYKGNNFAALSLPYLGKSQSMYVFLPDHGVDLAAFQSQLTPDNWTRWMQAFRLSDVNVSMPRFKITFSDNLNETLKDLGITDAFSQAKANFSEMIKQGSMWISRVVQKTYMDVNEEGTEAAAVTAVLMAARAMPMRPEPIVEFKVDRPFIVALVDNQSNEILFLGTIARP